MVKPQAYTIPRGADPDDVGHDPQGRTFIQRNTLPINMLCNEKSFSNAELISHAFKTLGRGTLVGQETYGAVISTGGTTLIDGTWVRLPFRGWYLPDGMDLENHGAVPDLIVPQTPEDESRQREARLRAAAEDLLKRLSQPNSPDPRPKRQRGLFGAVSDECYTLDNHLLFRFQDEFADSRIANFSSRALGNALHAAPTMPQLA